MKIHELLDSPEKWTQGTYARDSSGCSAPIHCPRAVSWYLMGAAHRCYPEVKVLEVKVRLRDELRRRTGDGTVVNWNDDENRTFDEVRNLLLKLDV